MDDFQRAFGVVEGKLDSLIGMIKQHLEDDKENFGAIKERLGKVERKVYWFSGAWAVVGGIVAFFLGGRH